MSGLMKKRSREYEASQDSAKRFFGETERILHLFEDFESLDKIQTQEDSGASEVVVNGVMRSLEEEIHGVKCSGGSRGPSRNNSAPSDMISGYPTTDCEIDLGYLLGASDKELGIPPSPLLNSDGQPLPPPPPPPPLRGEGFYSDSDFAENPELKSIVDSWNFEDDFVDCAQFTVFEDKGDGALDFVSQGSFADGDYFAPWRLEIVCDIY